MTRPTSLAPAALASIAVLGITSPAVAQAKYTIGVHVSRNDALPAAPTLGGLTLGSFSGPLGMRLNGAVNLVDSRPPNLLTERGRTGIGAWSADADVVLAPFRNSIVRALFLGAAPYGFVGVGMQGVRRADGSDPSLTMWSYGAGATLPLFLGLALDADARRRVPLDTRQALPDGFAKAWEYRAGVSFSFGGGGARHSARSDRRRHARTPRPVSTTARVSHRVEGPATLRASRVMVTADRYVGMPYTYGGNSPSDGFDCSGFVQYVFAQHGLRLPRTSRQIATVGRAVTPDLDELRAGDLVLFSQDDARVDHVAIYVGGDRIVHATASGGGVRYDDLRSPRGRWFLERMVGARRLMADGRSLVNELDVEDALEARVTRDGLDPPDRAPRPR